MSSPTAYDLPKIAFPEDIPPISKVSRKVEIPPALKYITKLFYRAGTSLSLVYLFLIFVIQPLLELQFMRRRDYSSYVLKRARLLLTKLSQRQRLPVVAIKRGTKLYSDAQVQTDPGIEEEYDSLTSSESQGSFPSLQGGVCGLKALQEPQESQMRSMSGVLFEDEQLPSANILQDKLNSLKGTLHHYVKYNVSIDELHPLNFQISKFQGTIDAYNHAQLFKAPGTMSGQSSSAGIRNDIREIKGLFLRGDA